MISITFQSTDDGQIYIHNLELAEFNKLADAFSINPDLNKTDNQKTYLHGMFNIGKPEIHIFSKESK